MPPIGSPEGVVTPGINTDKEGSRILNAREAVLDGAQKKLKNSLDDEIAARLGDGFNIDLEEGEPRWLFVRDTVNGEVMRSGGNNRTEHCLPLFDITNEKTPNVQGMIAVMPHDSSSYFIDSRKKGSPRIELLSLQQKDGKRYPFSDDIFEYTDPGSTLNENSKHNLANLLPKTYGKDGVVDKAYSLRILSLDDLKKFVNRYAQALMSVGLQD